MRCSSWARCLPWCAAATATSLPLPPQLPSADYSTRPTQIEIAGLLAFLLKSYVDFWIILALLLTNATLGFIEEMNAQASISALKDGMIRKLPTKRDGNFTPLDIAELVPGDVVFLRGGNVVPADC